jgi:predicted acetyltransferase
MSELRVLAKEDIEPFVDIVANAYPGMKIVSPEERERTTSRLLEIAEEDQTVALYGLFREGSLQGGMRFHDFRMNLLGTRIAVAGVGLIAVDLTHKKEHVAKEMVEFFHQHYRERGFSMAALYPFRPDFYKKMGYGYGTKMSQYRVLPAGLPQGPSKARVRYLSEEDLPALLDCYHRFVDQTHGMMEKSPYEIRGLKKAPPQRLLGYEKDGQLQGYLVLGFEHGESFIVNDIHVREFIYETPAALLELMTFLHTQADQIRRIILNTQDECFHHILQDPRNGNPDLIPSVYHESNIQGVGLMYRVIDVPRIFGLLKEHNFGGQTLRLALTIEDSFLPENAGTTLLSFEQGYVGLSAEGEGEVEVTIDIAEFSSMLMGVVNFGRLYSYGLADISDSTYIDVVDQLFAVKDKPYCTTPF